MASAEAIAKLETKAVAAEKLIELLRQQISQVGQILANLSVNSVSWFLSVLSTADLPSSITIRVI